VLMSSSPWEKDWSVVERACGCQIRRWLWHLGGVACQMALR
jgi:hypothetical protein